MKFRCNIGDRVVFNSRDGSPSKVYGKQYRTIASKGEVGVVVDVSSRFPGVVIVEIPESSLRGYALVECNEASLDLVRGEKG